MLTGNVALQQRLPACCRTPGRSCFLGVLYCPERNGESTLVNQGHVTQKRDRFVSLRTVLLGLATGAAIVIVYWFAQGGRVVWSPGAAVMLGLIGVAVGGIVGAMHEAGRWTTWEAVLGTALAAVCGVVFWVWGIAVWKFISPLKLIPGIGYGVRDLFYGVWFLPAVLVPYIVRRPGTAVLGELIAVIVQAFIGTEWGLTLIVSGLIPGGLAEIVFAAYGWRRFSLGVLLLAGAAAGLGSFLVDVNFLYAHLELLPKASMVVGRVISGAVLSGLVTKLLGDALARTGVLDNLQIARDARVGGR